jgi:hypothetical protein
MLPVKRLDSETGALTQPLLDGEQKVRRGKGQTADSDT